MTIIHNSIWRINVDSRLGSIEPVSEAYNKLGGRSLIPRILLDEGVAGCDPMGPINKLIWSVGLLVGHKVSSCDRISLGGKSPLTGGVKESNAGGSTGLLLSHLGIRALVLEGGSNIDEWFTIHISVDGVKFESADDLVGLGVYESSEKLIERYGKKVGITLIGPAGEMGMYSAGVQNLDKDGVASRICARGGLGAVMGSKKIKAIVIDAENGEKPPLHDPQLFKAARKYYTEELIAHPQTKNYTDYGTAAMAAICNGFGALPTRNFSTGQFEHVDDIGGEKMRDLLLERGGASDTSHACMAGCIIKCSNCFGDVNGDLVVSPVEFETIGLVGSNLGIDNLDDIARLNWEINDLGMDTIEVGAALGVAAEGGLMDFGDADMAMKLLHEIRTGTDLGKVLGNGVVSTGNHLEVKRVAAVKGQAMSAYDPRAIKGNGVTYATSPQGADHTCGNCIRAEIDHLSPEGQVEVSRDTQIKMAGYDTLGACLFGGFGFASSPGSLRDMVRGRYGWEVDDDILMDLGKETIKLEIEFNNAAGFGPEDNRLPDWMLTEKLPPFNSVFDVPNEELDNIFNW
ncbi:MAG TPA: aldehyde ferredoxin oxidoreductase [Chloroflexi bacterium]|nr:aldehyde ferredoxin oxidoreductase [Chloroflexota bacterium]